MPWRTPMAGQPDDNMGMQADLRSGIGADIACYAASPSGCISRSMWQHRCLSLAPEEDPVR